jgi:hypothetical protein
MDERATAEADLVKITSTKSSSSSEKIEPIQNHNFLQIYRKLELHPRPHGRNITRIANSGKYGDKFHKYILNKYHSFNLCQTELVDVSINYNTKTKKFYLMLYDEITHPDRVSMLYFKKHIEKMILKCKDLMLYINLGIEQDGVGHANIILIYNNNIELYEPNFAEGHTPFGNGIALKFVENLAKSLNFNYISPNIICPIGLQSYEVYSKIKKATSKEPGGYCQAFTYLWLALRLSYPSLSPTQLHDVVMNIGPENLTRLIEDFTFTMLYHSEVLPNKDSSSKNKLKVLPNKDSNSKNKLKVLPNKDSNSKNKLEDAFNNMALKDSAVSSPQKVSSHKPLILKTKVKVSLEKPLIKRTRVKQSSSSLSPTMRHKNKKQQQ